MQGWHKMFLVTKGAVNLKKVEKYIKNTLCDKFIDQCHKKKLKQQYIAKHKTENFCDSIIKNKNFYWKI